MKRKEIYWLFGPVAFVLIMIFVLFGSDGFKPDSTLDINIHDTYFVIAHIHFVLLFSILIFFGVYLFRTLRQNFKNLTANLILMISTILLILVLIGIDSIVDSLLQQTTSYTIYPPLSAGENQPEFDTKENDFTILASVLFFTEIVLLAFLAYCGFQTGRNYKQNK